MSAHNPTVATSSSPADRAVAGKACRKAVPRSSHAGWEPAPNRADPVAILTGQNESRVAELVPIRHGRMLTSAFSFYRGGAAIMAADLAAMPDSGLRVQLCGDAHLSNFGAFEAPNRSLVFDINDFDETLPGPFEWDVKRLAASFAVAGLASGFDEASIQGAVRDTVREYRVAMREFAAMRGLDVWYARLDMAQLTSWLEAKLRERDIKAFRKGLAKAEHKDSLRALDKLSEEVDGRRRIRSDPPLLVPIDELAEGMDTAEALQGLLAAYRATLARDRAHLAAGYRYVDAARKVVGVGSVGTRAWIIMLLGRDDADPLFLQAKEAEASVLEPYAGASEYSHHGQRVVEGQRLMQAASDIFLGWVTAPGIDGRPHDFYVRQLWDGKASVAVEALDTAQLEQYGKLCGWTLARAHARSGDRIAIASYLGGGTVFDEAIVSFAQAYAAQNQRDFERFAQAAEADEVEAQPGI
jgi:uncharacterized protein (DUF2252 family)